MAKSGENRKFTKLMKKAGFEPSKANGTSHVKYVHTCGYIETCTTNVRHANRLFAKVRSRLRVHLKQQGNNE